LRSLPPAAQNLAGSLTKKSGKSYSETANFMKSRMSTSHISIHPRITHPHESTEPRKMGGPQSVLPLGGRQNDTTLRIEQKPSILRTGKKIKEMKKTLLVSVKL
jgi:hypothetical protein